MVQHNTFWWHLRRCEQIREGIDIRLEHASNNSDLSLDRKGNEEKEKVLISISLPVRCGAPRLEGSRHCAVCPPSSSTVRVALRSVRRPAPCSRACNPATPQKGVVGACSTVTLITSLALDWSN